jgi:hypothetical protein
MLIKVKSFPDSKKSGVIKRSERGGEGVFIKLILKIVRWGYH